MPDDKTLAYDQLNATFVKAQRLHFALLRKGAASEAKEVKKRLRLIQRELDDLTAQAANQWSTKAKAATKSLSDLNGELQRDIRAIEKAKKRLDRVTDALAKLDKAIALAQKFTP